MAKHRIITAAVMGILAGTANAQLPTDFPSRASEPMPVAASFVQPGPGDPSAMAGAAPMGDPGQMMFPPPMGGPMAGPGPGGEPPPSKNDMSLPAYDPNAFFGNPASPQPARPWITIGGEALFGYSNKGPNPTPLVTSTTTPNPNASVGAIGEPGVYVVNGGGQIDYGLQTGVRVTASLDFQQRIWWLLPIEFSMFYMAGTVNNSYIGNSIGSPVYARPVFANELGYETAYLSSFPQVVTGTIGVASSSDLWGMEINTIGHTGVIDYKDGQITSLSFFAGLRYLDLHESLTVNSSSTPVENNINTFFGGQPFGAGATTNVNDSFVTHNHFTGPQVGSRFDWQFGPWYIDITGKIAFGGMDEVVHIQGTSVLTQANGAVTMLPGGILAVPSNIGRYQQTEFAYVPEGTFKLGLDVCKCVKLEVGYDLLYINNVARPGTFVNRNVDTTQVPVDSSYNINAIGSGPNFVFRTTDYWMQAISVGLTFNY